MRGQLLPIFALFAVVLLGMAALGADVGYWRYQQRLAQTAADSAAIAGAAELAYASANDWSTAAANDATANGFTTSATQTVSAINPPTSGAYNGNAEAVQVTVSEQVPSFFAAAVGFTPRWISATAVAVLSSPTTCVYALSSAAGTTGAAIYDNGADMTATNCGFVSNGGLYDPGSDITAALIGSVDPICNGGTSCGTNQYSQAQPTTISTQSDPCPTIPGCAYLKANPPNSGTCLNASPTSATSVTIPAGRYCTELTLTGGSTITLSPGVFEFDQGCSLYATSSITGSGVTLYNGTGGDKMSLQASAITLSAPTSGNTAGIVLYQNPSNTSLFEQVGTTTQFTGVMYFPTATVESNNPRNTWDFLVANILDISGGEITVPTTANQYPGFSYPTLVQ